jgi:xylulokinase
MGSLILAHDLGTTGNKASLFDASGHLLASATSAYDTAYPRAAWAEQDPADWWDAVASSTRQLFAQSAVAPEDVAVVSFSGQMMGCLPVDDRGMPLRSAIIWADQRAEAEAEHLAAALSPERVYRITGHRASASYTAAKILWLRQHQPDIFRQAHRFLQAKDYAVFRLTGLYATDYSDASGTNLFDLQERRWSDEILDSLDLAPELLPSAVPSSTVVGYVTQAAAEETGLRAGTPVVIGGGDGACATAGAGVVQRGDAYCYIGSSSWIAFVSRDPLYDPLQRTFTFAHLDPAYLFPTGTMQCAGGSFDWLERLLRGDAETRQYAELDALAANVEPGAEGLLFLPYLIGERSPHWNPRARGSFVGLTMAHGRAEMARAVLEGVALNLRIILDAFRQQGAPIRELRVIGGGARSPLWRQILADVLNLPLLRAQLTVEATSLGAAVAGGVGVGLFDGYDVVHDLVALQPAEAPRPDVTRRYDEVYDLFNDAYGALAPIYDRIADLAEGRTR